MCNPRGACPDGHGRIFVTDGPNGRILVLRAKDGSLLQVSLIEGVSPSKRNSAFTIIFFGKRYEGEQKQNKHMENNKNPRNFCPKN